VPSPEISHHPICRTTDEITKLRVGFYASATKDSKKFINYWLFERENLISNLIEIINRFSFTNFATTGDIKKKVFLKIKIDEQQRGYTQFLWY